MFHMYDNFFYKRDVTCSDPSPCFKPSHLLKPPPPSSVTYFMDGPLGLHLGLSSRKSSYRRLKLMAVPHSRTTLFLQLHVSPFRLFNFGPRFAKCFVLRS